MCETLIHCVGTVLYESLLSLMSLGISGFIYLFIYLVLPAISTPACSHTLSCFSECVAIQVLQNRGMSENRSIRKSSLKGLKNRWVNIALTACSFMLHQICFYSDLDARLTTLLYMLSLDLCVCSNMCTKESDCAVCIAVYSIHYSGTTDKLLPG